MEIDLTGQRAIVTGASTGIGRAIAKALAGAGADVAIHYGSSREEAEETARAVESQGRRAFLVQADFRDPTAAGKAVEAAVNALGTPIDILVNNAGSLIGRSAVEEMDAELWQEVIALNLSSVFFATKAALPHLGPGARIVNVSSVAARHGGGPGAFAYAAAKGGVMTLTRGLAKELASRNIRVNAIAPGVIETPFHDKFSTPELLETFRKGIPLGRLGTSDECAGAVLYLVSPLASYVTGQSIDINGGQWFA
ncbi:MAG: 3-oxoacyl-ACP reductase FabG [Chloroflexi bacterium]|nr:MAG: 3-oxoacyl-ACP reductase FabG [Chloroflexota bacterium]TME35497.1 MAG: 3-oxoacyl-ACP reductase FabG [Chloroflexota bacterium]